MKKLLPVLILVTGTALFLFFSGWRSARPVSAQCGTASSCDTCHQVRSQFPVNTNGDWHIDHANYDLCADCHKGNAASSDQSAAHTGMTENLSEMGASCQNCHPDDYLKFYEQYATLLGISTTPQIAVQNPLSGISNALCVTPVVVNPNIMPAQNNSGDLILIIILAAAVLIGGGLIYWNEKRGRTAKKEEK